MIPFLDGFLDTREKRYHLFLMITGLAWILLLLPYVFMGYSLIRITSYQSLFEVLQMPVLDSTYLSRLIVDVVTSANRSLPHLITACIENARWYEIGAVLLLLLCYPIVEKKRITTILLSMFCIEGIAIMILVSMGLQAQTLSAASVNIRIIGAVVIVFQCIAILILLHHTYRQMRLYGKALQYRTEEIKEHMRKEDE